MSETYPRKNLCEALFAGHTPSSVGFECKGTKLFTIYKIYNVQFVFFFARRDIAEHLTDSKARGKYKKSTGWSLNGNGVVTR